MTQWQEDSIVLISAIEHYSYCPRQCALIHVEHVYDENVFTLRGSMAHSRADEPVERSERGIRVERALPIWSERYGLYGRADVVEFHGDGLIVPVEYKLGGKRVVGHEELQLCAQAVCLEEMFQTPVAYGEIYSSSSNTRRRVELDEDILKRTLDIIELIRAVNARGVTPAPVNDNRCPNCSLIHACMPSGVDDLARLAGAVDLFQPSEGEVAE